MPHPPATSTAEHRPREDREPSPSGDERELGSGAGRRAVGVKKDRAPKLVSGSHADSVLLVMPACKDGMVREKLGDSYMRRRNPSVCTAEHVERWRQVLHSDDLHSLVHSAGLGVAFFAFPHIYPHLDLLGPPAHVEVLHLGITGSLESLFRRARILLTDDASVALDIAALEKPIVYFRAPGAGGAQGAAIGAEEYLALDDARNGLGAARGPVCNTEDELVNALERMIKSGLHRASGERGTETMLLRDLGRRARALEALLSLDSSNLDVDAANRQLVEAAELASEAGEWGLAASRWRRVMGLPERDRPSHAKLRLAAALRELGEFHPAAGEERLGGLLPNTEEA